MKTFVAIAGILCAGILFLFLRFLTGTHHSTEEPDRPPIIVR